MSGIIAVTMPKFGLAMTEGKIVSWAKPEGAEVKVGDELADIETTKITNAYESPATGVLRRHVANEQEELAVGALIAVIADPKVSDPEIDVFISSFQDDFSKQQETAVTTKSPEPQTIEVGGQRVRYLTLGEHEGRPVVFIHGFGGDLNNWLFTQPPVAERHTTFALDLPGHGGSSKNAPAKIAELAAEVAGALTALGVPSAHLVGHSLGGAIALDIALSQPSKVASLTLICPAGLGKSINADFIDGFVTADRRKTLEPVLQKLFANKELVSRDMIDDLIRYKRIDGAKAALSGIAEANFPQGKQVTDFASQLGKVGVPIQIVWGENDEILQPVDPATLPQQVDLHVIKGSGHMPHMENASQVNELIVRFLERAA